MPASSRRSISDSGPSDFDDFLGRPGSAERYLSKRLEWLLNLDIRRTEFNLRVFGEERSGRTQADGTPLEDLWQRGVSVDFSMQPGPRTEFTLSGRFVNRENEFDDETDFLNLEARLEYELTRRLELTGAYSYSEQKPVAGSAFREYVANVVGLYVTLSL